MGVPKMAIAPRSYHIGRHLKQSFNYTKMFLSFDNEMNNTSSYLLEIISSLSRNEYGTQVHRASKNEQGVGSYRWKGSSMGSMPWTSLLCGEDSVVVARRRKPSWSNGGVHQRWQSIGENETLITPHFDSLRVPVGPERYSVVKRRRSPVVVG